MNNLLAISFDFTTWEWIRLAWCVLMSAWPISIMFHVYKKKPFTDYEKYLRSRVIWDNAFIAIVFITLLLSFLKL